MSSRTALVVDDVEYTRRIIGDILGKAHYTVVAEAKNGREAFEYYAKLKPEIIIMDLLMPEMSGIDASRKILQEFPEARIIVLTGMVLERVINEVTSIGVRDYIIKPIIPSQVIKSVETVMTSEIKLTQKLKGKAEKKK